MNGWDDSPHTTAWCPPLEPSRSEAMACGDWADKAAADTRYNGWDEVVSREVHDEASAQKTQSSNMNGWEDSPNTAVWSPQLKPSRSEATIYGDWADKTAADARYNQWDEVVSPEVHGETSTKNARSGEKHVAFSPAAGPAPSAPPLPHQALDGMPEDISVRTDQATEEDVMSCCVICWEATVDGACIPCGHMAGCMSCLSEINAKNRVCPICRTEIEQVIKLYTV